MATFQVKSQSQIEVSQKPRVFFTCHPEDFECCYPKLCEDIFKTHDCAIYHTEDPNAPIADREREAVLGRINLLVTPNVLEETEGKPNFVMGEEYPAARRTGIPILPAEMEKTDHTILAEKFRELPPCVSHHEEAAFHERLLSTPERIAVTENDQNPMHNFLIGLAYLEDARQLLDEMQ